MALKVTGENFQKAMQVPDYTDALVLSASTDEYVTVPDWAHIALIAPTNGVWCDRGTTCAVPAADVTDGTSAFYISGPALFRVDSEGTLAFIAEQDTVVSISYFV